MQKMSVDLTDCDPILHVSRPYKSDSLTKYPCDISVGDLSADVGITGISSGGCGLSHRMVNIEYPNAATSATATNNATIPIIFISISPGPHTEVTLPAVNLSLHTPIANLARGIHAPTLLFEMRHVCPTFFMADRAL